MTLWNSLLGDAHAPSGLRGPFRVGAGPGSLSKREPRDSQGRSGQHHDILWFCVTGDRVGRGWPRAPQAGLAWACSFLHTRLVYCFPSHMFTVTFASAVHSGAFCAQSDTALGRVWLRPQEAAQRESLSCGKTESAAGPRSQCGDAEKRTLRRPAEPGVEVP